MRDGEGVGWSRVREGEQGSGGRAWCGVGLGEGIGGASKAQGAVHAVHAVHVGWCVMRG